MTINEDDLAQVQGLRRLKNLNIRSVGLVDHPAIEEPFTGFKRGEAPAGNGKKASAQREENQEVAMDEKMKAALEAMFKSALEPFVTRLDAVEAKAKDIVEAGKNGSADAVEGLKSSLEELKGKFSAMVEDVKSIMEKKSVDADGMKTALDELGTKFQEEADRIAEESIERFKSIEGRVEKMEGKASQKLPGQEEDPEKKSSSKWGSITRHLKGSNSEKEQGAS